MGDRSSLRAACAESESFLTLSRRLGESFIVRDVMVPRDQITFVRPGDLVVASQVVAEKNFSAVPCSEDGKNFPFVFETKHPPNSTRQVTEERKTDIHDYIPDSTPLAEAFGLFRTREWYFALRKNEVAGLITYWAFNSREFRVQVYVALSRLEELSREVLAANGCGLSGPEGLKLTVEVLDKVRKRFEASRKELGGNRFVDELDFHNVHDALRKHSPWRTYLHQRIAESLSNTDYDKLYGFTELRDDIMHGRVVFPTHQRFKEGARLIGNMVELIGHLGAYLGSLKSESAQAAAGR